MSYERINYKLFEYKKLNQIKTVTRRKKTGSQTYANCIIMLDTETSKKYKDKIDVNYIVAFSISIRYESENICTLYGNKPSQCVECLNMIKDNINSDNLIIYIHNMSYDWTFLRRFLMASYGTPIHQLNTKSHYPIYIEFENGLILKDSLILAQRKLEKWAIDLNVEHKKAVGKWDYDKIRNQNESYSNDELDYTECDVLAGVECIDSLMKTLNKKIFSMPYTATGIPREKLRKIAFKNRGKEWFERLVPSFDQYKKLEKVYHGGYTHANRHYIAQVLNDLVKCFDFSSSYPFVLLSEKYPCEKFQECANLSLHEIVKQSDEYAFMYKLVAIGVKLKNDSFPMPCLQNSKMEKIINPVIDNGRILCCDYCEIYLNEQDAITILEQYDFIKHVCIEVEYCRKDFLPRWFTDFVYDSFKDKTQYKGGDPVLYAIAKAMLNAIYGMCCQHCVKEVIEEDYLSGDYIKNKFDENEESENSEKFLYDKYINSRNSFLPYQIGVWCTSYAQKNLFTLGKLCKIWLYSDTDSCYGIEWDFKAIENYNDICKNKLLSNGYGAVEFNNKEYWLGIAVSEDLKDEYSEFITLGAKRYCGRCREDNKLHITVAGVPKSGAQCLNDNIYNFRKGMIFSGKITGKKTHTYFYNDIYTDENGNEIGDSIDLSQCDYLLDSIEENENWENLFNEEVIIQTYDV